MISARAAFPPSRIPLCNNILTESRPPRRKLSRRPTTNLSTFLNLDLYAQDTWKVTKKLTWTFGIRDTLNSNPLNPHNQIARLRGSFDSISHDVNQPLNAAIQTGLGNVFSSTPLAILQPRTAIAWQFEPKTVLRTGFGIFSDILPGSIADVVGVNPPYVKTFQGGLLGTVGGTAIAPGVTNSAVDATAAANQTFSSGFAQGQLSCASAQANPATCLPPVAITAVPRRRTSRALLHGMESWPGASNSGPREASRRNTSARARSISPISTQVNGYQTVCQGCFAPFPYAQPTDPRFGAVTQFSTGANSHYDGLQLTAMKRLGHGLMGQINYTWSRCMDEVSNGGFLQFSVGRNSLAAPRRAGAELWPLRLRHPPQFNAQYVYQLPVKNPEPFSGLRAERLADFGNRVLAQRPSLLCSQHALFREWKWHCERQRTAIRERCSRRAALRTQSDSGRHTAGHGSMAQSECVCFDCGPEHRRLQRRRHAGELPVRKPGPQRFARPRFCLERFLPHEMVSA